MVSLPESERRKLQQRLASHARTGWDQRCRRVDVRFRGEHAYVDAFEADPWFMPDATEEEKDRIRQTPTKLCRLSWTGDPDLWVFAFYKYSDDRYEPSVTLNGSFVGSPESCFDTAAQLYLQ